MDRASRTAKQKPKGDYVQSAHIESDKVYSRTLWRLPELDGSNRFGVQETFMIEKENLETSKKDRQYFITNRLPHEWRESDILDRILLHWDTETGVFGVKDNTFNEDKIRYFSVAGMMSHVALLNMSWNCLSAPVFDHFWKGESMSCRVQFFKDHPDFNPFVKEC